MNVSPAMLRYQGAMLKTLGSVALSAMGKPPTDPVSTPGPLLEETIDPLPAELVDKYVLWSGADPVRYQHTLPPHLFPQWGFPLISRTISNIPYKLTGVLNQGCRIEVRGPIPNYKPLHLSARLESIEDDGYKARIHQRLVTGTSDVKELLIADVFAVVPLKKKDGAQKKDDISSEEFELVDRWKASAVDGRNFGFLTGDLNPIHWVAPYARAAGFKSTILHGFGSFARSYECIANANPSKEIKEMDVRFIKPLHLPASTELLLSKKVKQKARKVELKDAKGNLCMAGTVVIG